MTVGFLTIADAELLSKADRVIEKLESGDIDAMRVIRARCCPTCGQQLVEEANETHQQEPSV